jgi:eukaryotic-like serine/threonine-protein kinase
LVVGVRNPPSASRPRREGELVGGKYKLERRLGEGGMGVVFSARHTGTRRRVAVKCIASHANSPTAHARFQREAETAGRIDHPNVVQMLDIGEDAAGRFLVMEYLEGETLAEVLERRRLAPTDAIDVLIPALRGVHAAHKQNIVHRDLKPENIFVCRTGDGPVQIKVLDFGISKLWGEEAAAEQLTRVGTLLGTPQYMSPERLVGEGSADLRNDVYAMGVILYEALSGRLPYDGADLKEILVKISRQRAPALSDLVPGLPAELALVVHKAMAPGANDRFQDIESFARALEPFAGNERFAPLVRDPTEAFDAEKHSEDDQSTATPSRRAVPEQAPGPRNPRPRPPAIGPAARATAAARPPAQSRPVPAAESDEPVHEYEMIDTLQGDDAPAASQPVAAGQRPEDAAPRMVEQLLGRSWNARAATAVDARRQDTRAASETFRARAPSYARPIRELVFRLVQGRVLRGWASACRTLMPALIEAALRIEHKKLVTALEQFDAPLTRAASGSDTSIDAGSAVALMAAYGPLSEQLPEAFPPVSQLQLRAAQLFEGVVLRAPGMRKRSMAKLQAAGIASLEQLLQVPPDVLATAAGIEPELAQALEQRVRQFEAERQYRDPSEQQQRIEARLRELTQRLETLQRDFERAEREDSAEAKRELRNARQAALLELNQLLSEAGEPALAEELERYPIGGKVRCLERYLTKV